MSDVPASYAFLPWLRRGIAREITRLDFTLTGAARAEVPVTLELDAAGDRRDVAAALALHGPGEVGAVDARVVIRTNPKPDELDAEPNYFAAAEFDQADFPWRFTPARADARTRLRPWLVLAVLTENEITSESTALSDGTLPSVTVSTAAALPLIDQSWAWAHVQVDAFDQASESLDAIVTGEPARVRSRVIGPRRLLPRTRYRAILVPSFERGRRAGLREPIDESVDGLAPAWVSADTGIWLPVYFSWTFQTGVKGDFEFLARRLKARDVGPDVGIRDMDVRMPDPALPAASTTPLGLEGALMSPAATSTSWPSADKAPYTAALAELLNRPAEALATAGATRTVAPPLWGQWHAATDRLDMAATARPVWFHELNADPRLRTAAGLGAEVIRRNDQQLMAEAWNQVDGVLSANAELRGAQLARDASERLFNKNLVPLASDGFLEVTAPVHARFTASLVTVAERLRRTPVPAGALDGQMRRTRRANGPIGKRLRRLRQAGTRPLLDRLNRGEVRARPVAPTPEGLATLERFAAAILPRDDGGPGRRWLIIAAVLLGMLALILLFVAPILAAIVAIGAAATAIAATRLRRDAGQGELQQHVIDGTLTPAEVMTMSPPAGFVPAIGAPGVSTPQPPSGLSPEAAAASVERFRTALAGMIGQVNAPPAPGPLLVVADLPSLSRDLAAKLDPRVTIPASITARLAIADWVTWNFPDPLEPIMAAPLFETPMYEPLRDISQEFLLPGVGRIPPNTVTLVIANQRFIEAYMAGLSHEMARELLYHEYPTDQRGTYFRQFWDVRGAIGEGVAADPEKLRDIEPIHLWNGAEALGTHSGRSPEPREGHLVFLIKGELLRRYPGTLVYAVKTVIGEDGERTLGIEEKYPIFEGRLTPDIAFFGFDLLAEEVNGETDPDADQGWYFLLQEQPTEPAFGLDVDNGRYAATPVSWNNLNWAHLAADAAALGALTYVDLNAELPDTRSIVPEADEPVLAWHADSGLGASGSNGSDLAYITLQRPFRVAIHGSDMLSPGAVS